VFCSTPQNASSVSIIENHVETSRRQRTQHANDTNAADTRSHAIVHDTVSTLTVFYLCLRLLVQTTKKAKGAVKRRRETSSLPRFGHACVRNALLERVNVNGETCLR
jgi:hypothetical protein